ncbi:hypothetical protein FOL47_003453 [Perkinsus chesapeaki]|uniref:Uncharacterized protein n=1 Tax=Perkinsus chesapeaki TaxID=330153 RepID=A0A7J6M7W3_PERCH|nr:hypothetical protein FOL47_003453 [Perkinsus chesapeaki]
MTNHPAPPSSASSRSSAAHPGLSAIDPLVLLGAQLLSSVSVKSVPPRSAEVTPPSKPELAPYMVTTAPISPPANISDQPIPIGNVRGGEGVKICHSASLIPLSSLPPHSARCLRCHGPWELRQQKTGFMKRFMLPVLRCSFDKTRNHDLWLYEGQWVSRWQKRRKLGTKERKVVEEAIANGEIPPPIARPSRPISTAATPPIANDNAEEGMGKLLTVRPKQKFANRLCLLLAEKTSRCTGCEMWLSGVKVEPDANGYVLHRGKTWCHLVDKTRKIGDTLRKYRCSETGERLTVARNPCGTCLWAGMSSAPEKYSTVPLREIRPVPPIEGPKEDASEASDKEATGEGVIDRHYAPFAMFEEKRAPRDDQRTKRSASCEAPRGNGVKIRRADEEGFSLDADNDDHATTAQSFKWLPSLDRESRSPSEGSRRYDSLLPQGLASLGDESPGSCIFRIDTPGGCSTPSFATDMSPLTQSATTKDPVRALEDLMLHEDR